MDSLFNSERSHFYSGMLYSLILLLMIGLIMVYSSSFIYSKEILGNSGVLVIKHSVHLFLGVFLCYLVSRSNFDFWIKYSYGISWISFALLLLTMIPSLGIESKGASRWLNLKIFTLQPGELFKLAAIFSSLAFFEKVNERNLKENLKFGAPILLSLAVLIKQPDYGTFLISMMVIGFIAYLSSLPRKIFYSMLLSGITLGLVILVSAPYRVKRLLTYLDPWKNARSSGFQIIQSYLAFAKGSVFGQGIGNSVEKLFYLPEAHNDFIFSVIGEEFGFIGVCVTICLFVFFIYCGMRISLSHTDRLRGTFVATVFFSIGFQAFLNMAVVLGLLPTKGLNLPFISSGGSSLIVNLLAIGFVISAGTPKEDLGPDMESQPNINSYFRSSGTSL